jgi:hypothetical protein
MLEQNNKTLQSAIEKIEQKILAANIKLESNIKESPNWKVTSHRYDLNPDNIDLQSRPSIHTQTIVTIELNAKMNDYHVKIQ